VDARSKTFPKPKAGPEARRPSRPPRPPACAWPPAPRFPPAARPLFPGSNLSVFVTATSGLLRRAVPQIFHTGFIET